MEAIKALNKVEIDQILESLGTLRRYKKSPAEFWSVFLKSCVQITCARAGLLLIRGIDEKHWKQVNPYNSESLAHKELTGKTEAMIFVAEKAEASGSAWSGDGIGSGHGKQTGMLGIRLSLEDPKQIAVAVFRIKNQTPDQIEDARIRLILLSDIPADFQFAQSIDRAKNDVLLFSGALDLMLMLNAEERYMAVAMLFCNELSSRFNCGRVCLGWLQGGYIRVQAISHMEKFEKKMLAVQSLEAAMEESLDQDEEIVWPQPEGHHSIVQDHREYALSQKVSYMVSVPLRLNGDPIGVISCERESTIFSETEIRGLRVFCDLAARRLSNLKKYDRWIGARMVSSLREFFSKLIGVEHTFAKVMALVLTVVVAYILIGKWEYRVECPFIVKTDDVAFSPAPFDGYIESVHVQVGDFVQKGDRLLTLDSSELLLEESASVASRMRYAKEAEKARSQNALADMKISSAMKDQETARLELIRYHLAHANLESPFNGIVVEGDLKELQDAPVRKGDVLFKTAKIEKMFVELDVDEKDIQEVTTAANGEIAFVSQPDLKFPITIERIDPVSITKEEGNIFPARAVFNVTPKKWWRPGMSGIAKVNAGKRNILWILTHRTMDFLRLFLWW